MCKPHRRQKAKYRRHSIRTVLRLSGDAFSSSSSVCVRSLSDISPLTALPTVSVRDGEGRMEAVRDNEAPSVVVVAVLGSSRGLLSAVKVCGPSPDV